MDFVQIFLFCILILPGRGLEASFKLKVAVLTDTFI